MATKQEVLTQIQTWIVQNGANSITANVLRPILESILEQPNEVAGVLSNLNTTNKTNLVAAINELKALGSSGIKIHTGTSNPNTVPPQTFVLGDFYNRTSNGNTVNFYQYNGSQWVELVAKTASIISGCKKVTASHTIIAGDYSIIYAGTNTADKIFIAVPSAEIGRVILISNTSNVVINFSRNYLDNTRIPTSAILAGAVTKIQSDGIDWYKIN